MAWHGMAWHGMVMIMIMMLLAGCAKSSAPVDSEAEAVVRSIHRKNIESTTTEVVHDLGPILAYGQTLRYEFTLRNPANKPLRILGTLARTPCCSAVEGLPVSVPPLSTARVPVVFKPGFQKGRRRIQFELTTDDNAEPVRTFSLVSTLMSEMEIEMLDGSETNVHVGDAGKQFLRVTCRRMGEEGRNAPESIVGLGSLLARFRGEAVSVERPGGLVETSRDIELILPSESTGGLKSSSFVLSWPNTLQHEEPITWRVQPNVVVSPPGLVLKPSSDPLLRTITIQSRGRAIHILSVKARALEVSVILPTEAAEQHVLHLQIEATHQGVLETSELVIETDHPEQPTLSVSVLRLPGSEV
jgi:hypothetical protein